MSSRKQHTEVFHWDASFRICTSGILFIHMKRHEFLVLLSWPIIGSILSYAFNAGYILSLFFFYLIPSVYLSYYNRKLIKKTLIFSIVMSVGLSFLVEYIMEFTKSWQLGHLEFPQIWILNYISAYQILWAICFFYLIIMYYEVFFDRSSTKVVYPRTKWLFMLMSAFVVFIILGHYFFQPLLYINYFYLKIGVVLILLPIIAFLFKFPQLMQKFIKVTIFFAYYNLIYEITALDLGHWWFPVTGSFVGHVTVFNHTFPFEELFFWVVLGGCACLVYYEFFDDDEK